jgi:hypothetical protein
LIQNVKHLCHSGLEAKVVKRGQISLRVVLHHRSKVLGSPVESSSCEQRCDAAGDSTRQEGYQHRRG